MAKKERDLKYSRSVKGVITKIYNHQKENSKKRKHPQPAYTKEEFSNWILSHPHFHILYNNWVLSGYDTNKKPSCDRLDDGKPYTFDNIRIVTWEVNNKKGHDKIKDGTNKNQLKPVHQYDLKMKYMNTFFSMKEAERQTGVRQGNISSCCVGRYKTAGGFIWRFVNE